MEKTYICEECGEAYSLTSYGKRLYKEDNVSGTKYCGNCRVRRDLGNPNLTGEEKISRIAQYRKVFEGITVEIPEYLNEYCFAKTLCAMPAAANGGVQYQFTRY